jgi:hypothetical protein
MTTLRLIPSLCRANLGILRHKHALMDALVHRFGNDGAKEWYQSPCQLVGASIGQHVRHSMDHMELAILVAATAGQDLHYDMRVRGGTLEHDMEEAKKRIVNLVTMLETVTSDGAVKAHFMLSGDSGDEVALESTLSRELGFIAHHAIHHMAMIKIIAIHHVGLDGSDLPSDFGRAPSTIHHDATPTT